MTRALLAAVTLCVVTTQGAGAATDPVVRVLGNQEVLLRNSDGDVLSCAPSADANRVPRMACGLVVFRDGASRSPVRGSLVVQVAADGLRVTRYAAQPVELFHTPLSDAVMRLQVTRATHGTLRFKEGRSYYFSGTRIVCRLERTGAGVLCELVGPGLVPRRPGYAFAIGFRGTQVLAVGSNMRRTAVFSARHRR